MREYGPKRRLSRRLTDRIWKSLNVGRRKKNRYHVCVISADVVDGETEIVSTTTRADLRVLLQSHIERIDQMNAEEWRLN